MSIIELNNVYFDYAASEELEEQREEQARQEKKKKKKQSAEVFEGFEEPAHTQPALVPREDCVIRDLSLSVEEGEFVALVGRNGSGKSTLAKLMNGLILPVSGDVLVAGHNTKHSKELFEIRKTVGMVFQNPDNQMIASIVEDDVAFGPENIGVPREEIIHRVEWALEAVGMSEYREATPFRLSGGQKQRIAIAGMLAIKPRVLVLDESTAMLDPKGRREVLEVVRRLNREEGITVILITHYMDEAAECDRVVVMHGGKITADGTPEHVFRQTEQLNEAGLTIPSVMQLSQLLRARGVQVAEVLADETELVEEIRKIIEKGAVHAR